MNCSDGRQKPAMIYQDQLLKVQSSNTNNQTTDQNTRIQMQQQQILDLFLLPNHINTYQQQTQIEDRQLMIMNTNKSKTNFTAKLYQNPTCQGCC